MIYGVSGFIMWWVSQVHSLELFCPSHGISKIEDACRYLKQNRLRKLALDKMKIILGYKMSLNARIIVAQC